MKPESMDAVFQALAHAGRRRILDILKHNPGSLVGEVCAAFDTSRIAVLKNLRVLEEANLIVSQKSGRERRLYLNLVPIQMIHHRWTTEYSALWAERLATIKYRVEAEAESGAKATQKPTKRKRSKKTKAPRAKGE
ncbi:MAG: winged helix-turn-helix transcriptional regulator [Phycisphaerales bacterium]|nr:winged helix-turn-helix transcriptional regulator [Phycisphaerales bacterium]